MKYQYFIGIDPGLTGCIAIHNMIEDTWKLHDVPIFTTKSPCKKNKSGFKIRNEYDILGIKQILSPYVGIAFATLEKLHANPSAGGSKWSKVPEAVKMASGSIANFNNGVSMGVFRSALLYSGISYKLIAAPTWKKHRLPNLSDRSDKTQVLIATIECFPELYEELQRAKDHNRAESVQICTFGEQFFGGNDQYDRYSLDEDPDDIGELFIYSNAVP
mgnify:CR=1 FL=1